MARCAIVLSILVLMAATATLVTWNNVLLDSTTEKLAAIGNCDRSVFWILGHGIRCDSFYAFRLTNTGIAAAVASKAGIVHINYVGYMKFSPDGRRLGVAGGGIQQTVEVFDFRF